MIITLCGPPGSGKDTIAAILEEKTGFPIMSMGNLRRAAAKKKGMTIEAFNAWSEKNPKEGDIFFDDFQKQYAKEHDNFIMVSRMGWYFMPHALKVFIDVSLDEGARRIFEQKQKSNARNEQMVSSVTEQIALNKQRIASDKARYMKLYGTNPYDKRHFNLIIDSSKSSADKIASKIVKIVKNI
ncbi:MAG: cytidylate kinase family protein [Candidatus Woesearchaeota archaeon]